MLQGKYQSKSLPDPVMEDVNDLAEAKIVLVDFLKEEWCIILHKASVAP